MFRPCHHRQFIQCLIIFIHKPYQLTPLLYGVLTSYELINILSINRIAPPTRLIFIPSIRVIIRSECRSGFGYGCGYGVRVR